MREVGKAQLACFWGTGVRTMGISFAAVQKTAHTNNLLAVLKTESVAHPKSNTNKCLLISYVLLAKKPIIPFQNMPKNSKTLIFFDSPPTTIRSFLLYSPFSSFHLLITGSLCNKQQRSPWVSPSHPSKKAAFFHEMVAAGPRNFIEAAYDA